MDGEKTSTIPDRFPTFPFSFVAYGVFLGGNLLGFGSGFRGAGSRSAARSLSNIHAEVHAQIHQFPRGSLRDEVIQNDLSLLATFIEELLQTRFDLPVPQLRQFGSNWKFEMRSPFGKISIYGYTRDLGLFPVFCRRSRN